MVIWGAGILNSYHIKVWLVPVEGLGFGEGLGFYLIFVKGSVGFEVYGLVFCGRRFRNLEAMGFRVLGLDLRLCD